MGNTQNCNVTVIGAGPYGLSCAAYLKAAKIEHRIFGDTMSFWREQMPAGMCLRSNLEASHIADPEKQLTLTEYCRESGNSISKPIPLRLFVEYGVWYQRKAIPYVEAKQVTTVTPVSNGFSVTLADGDSFTSRRVVIAGGIRNFAYIPEVFSGIPGEWVSHSVEHRDLTRFKGRRVVVIGAGQSALESATLLQETGAEVEVIARKGDLNWVGLHPKLHRLGWLSKLLYSKRDVGPAGISRLVAMPNLFRRLPRSFQNRTAHRAIRPAVAGWLKPRMGQVPITLGRTIRSASLADKKLRIYLDDGSERLVDHALLATGFRVDVARYAFLSESLLKGLQTTAGYPVLKRGLESSIPGLHFFGKPATWSFGPILGFVSGAEFASTELVRCLVANNGAQ